MGRTINVNDPLLRDCIEPAEPCQMADDNPGLLDETIASAARAARATERLRIQLTDPSIYEKE